MVTSDLMARELVPKRRATCERLAECAFFNNLALPSVADTLKAYYCRGNYSSCARYQLAETGQPVPLDLWPTGMKA
jgi:hypothetical protein